MIWGMTLEPGKAYTEVIGEEVQLSMAAMESRKDLDGSSNSFCQIVMKTSKGEYVLCTLIHGVMFQQNLDLKLMPREKVTFSVQGPSVVYLVGYTASYPEDGEFTELKSEEDLGEEYDATPWETFESDSAPLVNIKEEPVDDLEEAFETGDGPTHQEGEAPSQQQQPLEQVSVEQMEGISQKESVDDEIVLSVAGVEGELKLEAPPTRPPDMAPDITSRMAQQGTYSMQTTDNGTVSHHTSQNSDYFYPETQQPDIPVAPPGSYQPPASSTGYAQTNPHAVLPPPEQFIPPQKTVMQRSHAGPMRHSMGRGGTQPTNTQRNYPAQRRHYGTNKSQPTAKSRSAPHPISVQQVRAMGSVQQQQSMPGPSQQDVPGPSTSDSVDARKFANLNEDKEEDGVEGARLENSTTRATKWGVRIFKGFHAVPQYASFPEPTAIGQTPSLAPRQTKHQQFLTEMIDTASVKFVCKICGKQIESIRKFKVHQNYHKSAGRSKCRFCDKTFHSKWDTAKHERIHTGERPYKCSVCGRGFAQVTARNGHEKRHYQQQ